MGKYYLFRVNLEDDETEKTPRPIGDDDTEYIKYNKFLNDCYGESIIDNEDYIALVSKKTACMILDEENFDKDHLENVYEILYDSLYTNRGEEFEENNNHEWASKIG